jgi:hypothetical protein
VKKNFVLLLAFLLSVGLGLSCYVLPPPAPIYVISNGHSFERSYRAVDNIHGIEILFEGTYWPRDIELLSGVHARIKNDGDQKVIFPTDLIHFHSNCFRYSWRNRPSDLQVKAHQSLETAWGFQASREGSAWTADFSIPKDEVFTLMLQYVVGGKDTVRVEDIHFQVP